MDRHEIAAALAEIATLLELTGENPFKVRAYQNASRILEGLTGDLSDLIARDTLVESKGIGRNLADHIAELARTGEVKEYRALRKSVPEGIFQILAIPGVGPKKARALWKERGIKTLGELELQARRHMLAELPGFGAKTEEKILAGIGMLRRFAGRWRIDEALAAALAVHEQVRGWKEVARAEIAGSIRRRAETVGDIDILASSGEPAKVMERFVKLPGVERVVQHGETKSEVVLASGIQCDLRVVDDAQYPFALHYFTGSKEHNVAMRALAKGKGCKLNEYGLFKADAKRSIACKDEKALFAALGLDFIAPELREDMGEVEAASKHALPKLVELSDLKGIVHAHSTYTDGTASIARMAEAARDLGMSWLAICDHSQAVRVAGGMTPDVVVKQQKEIDALNRKMKGFRVLKGIECDILADGSLDFDDELLSTFDVVIAAVHSNFGMLEEEQAARIAKALASPHVDILAHPTGRLLLSREGYAVDLNRVIEAAAKHGKAIEINCHPQRLDLDWRHCKRARERGVPLCICPDAHSTEELAHIAYGVGIARKGWLEKQDVLNCLSAEAFAKRFRSERGGLRP